MDDNARLLEQIRDLLQRNLELATLERTRATRADEERIAAIAESLAVARAHGRFYKRVVTVSAVVIVALVIFLLSVVQR